MKSILLLLSLLLSAHPLLAWDPDDETFDPTIHEVIADGSSRIGDPSPVYREGYEERGFTHVGFSKPEAGEGTVNLAFILNTAPDDPKRDLGGSAYLPVKNATALADFLAKGPPLKKPFVITEGSWMGKWTLTYDDEKGFTFTQERDGMSVSFYLSVPAAKKLAGALNHSIAQLQ